MLGFFRNTHASSMKKALKTWADLPVGDDGVRPMQDVEEQRFEKFGVLAHPLKVETLEPGERDRVFRVVEEKSELPAARPFREPVGNPMAERVREDAKRSQRRVNGIEILDLMVEVALLAGSSSIGAEP